MTTSESPRALVQAATDAMLDRAATLLRKGGLIAFPTETVYGLGADATDDKAITIFDRFMLSVADQVFTVNDPTTAAALITITDDAVTPTMTAANDLRIRIPAAFPMSWGTNVTTVTLGGTASGMFSIWRIHPSLYCGVMPSRVPEAPTCAPPR